MATEPTATCEVSTTSATGDRVRRRFVVEGIVQGVGFRPFVHRLAGELRLTGTVLNFTGGVEIEVEGDPSAVAAFGAALLTEKPPLAVIETLTAEDLSPAGDTDFLILPSREAPGAPVSISPDIATCPDCLRELTDPADRRHRYPFTNCTNCGPRYTITRRIPYDRPNTSMAPFPMCPDCAREYHDITDRRYHAQPVACPRCGPTLRFTSREGQVLTADMALVGALKALRAGQIVAIKGLGGFHLACDATNEEAVRRLRERKRREEKPLAVMAGSLGEVRRFAVVEGEGEELLQSPAAPIVLAPKRLPEALAPSVAPGSPDYGVMLPYTPLHHLLFADGEFVALVMTSGNLSEEPLCTDNAEARLRLDGICDGFLDHDRDILIGCDDSVLRWTQRGAIPVRRARGYAPLPIRLARPVRPLLAVGGHLKNTVCLASGTNAVLSQHIGDLENEATLRHFAAIITHLQCVLQVAPQALACDRHPGYLSTQWACERADELGVPLVEVQHHHAHIVACMADNDYYDPVVGLACDGTGYGDDGTIWGCEVLWTSTGEARRLGHLRPIPLPGGDAAIREPWRVLGAYLREAYGEDFLETLPPAVTHPIPGDSWQVLSRMISRGLNSPLASSAGRLFDAVAALLGLCPRAAFEGQPAMALEALASAGADPYPYAAGWQGQELVLDPRPTLGAMVDEVNAGTPAAVVASRFHETFARTLRDAAVLACERTGLQTVALSGGTFQNRLLHERLCDLLDECGLRVLHHRRVPPNDGGLALGQAVVAEAQLDGI